MTRVWEKPRLEQKVLTAKNIKPRKLKQHLEKLNNKGVHSKKY